MSKLGILVVIVIILGASLYLLRRDDNTPKLDSLPSPTPSIEGRIESSFNTTIPDDVEKTELKDVSGGTGSGIATRKLQSNLYTYTFLVDLPDPSDGLFYEAWIVKDNENISLGKLVVAKGGWMIESQTRSLDYNTVIVTEEKVYDKSPEKKLLEAQFRL